MSVSSVVIPDRTTAIIAWRYWDLSKQPDGIYLEAVTRRLQWPRREPFLSVCGRHVEPEDDADWIRLVTHGHASPMETCSCGIYALKLPKEAAAVGKFVVGRVALWGKVIEGEKGYRAQIAYPVALWLAREAWKHRASISEGYGVEVLPLPCIEETPEWKADKSSPADAAHNALMNQMRQVMGAFPGPSWAFPPLQSGKP